MLHCWGVSQQNLVRQDTHKAGVTWVGLTRFTMVVEVLSEMGRVMLGQAGIGQKMLGHDNNIIVTQF